MSDKSGKCCHCIRTEMQPKNSSIHNHLYNDGQLLATMKHCSVYLDVWFSIAGAVAQVQVLQLCKKRKSTRLELLLEVSNPMRDARANLPVCNSLICRSGQLIQHWSVRSRFRVVKQEY